MHEAQRPGQASRSIPTRVQRMDQTTWATTERAYDALGNALAVGDGDGSAELAVGSKGRDREGLDRAGVVYIAEQVGAL